MIWLMLFTGVTIVALLYNLNKGFQKQDPWDRKWKT